MPTTIDMHAHLLVPAANDPVGRRPELRRRAVERQAAQGAASVAHTRSFGPEHRARLTDPAVRLAAMDAAGIDVQLLAPMATQYHYWAPEDLAQEVVARLNAGIATVCRAHPDRFVGLASVSLQHPERAAAQLRHAVGELGLCGAGIGTGANGLELGDPRLDPLWSAAEELDALLFLHPEGGDLCGTRLDRWYLCNVVGAPTETTIALANLVFGGVLDRFPGLRVLAAHGGGYFPHAVGRADHAWHVRPEAHTCAHPPSAYLRRFWYDSLVHSPEGLAALVARVGADRVVLGSDSPFDMGSADPLGTLKALDDEDREAVRSETGRALLRR